MQSAADQLLIENCYRWSWSINIHRSVVSYSSGPEPNVRIRKGLIAQPCPNRETGEAGYPCGIISYGYVLLQFNDQHMRHWSRGELVMGIRIVSWAWILRCYCE